MNKNIIYILSLLTAMLFLGNGCSSFDDMNTDPDGTTNVTSGMLATQLILDLGKSGNNDNSELLCKRIFWGEQASDYQYNRLGKTSFSNIQKLTNAQKMVDNASPVNVDAYTGLYYLLKGFYFYRSTMETGDMPYNEALKGDANRYPKYDTQKEVFAGVLNDLAEADKYFELAGSAAFAGDPFYKGDPQKWRKAANVLRLQVLMSLQKRAEDTPELQIKETFAEIVKAGHLMTSNDDNFKITYSNKDKQLNPYHKTQTLSIEVYAGTNVIIDPLKQYKDYRLFYYFAPAQAFIDPSYVEQGQTPLARNDWNAYNGLDPSAVFSTEQAKIAVKKHNRLNDVYRNTFEGIPAIRFGYADMNFILAEAAERGWIEGSAEEYYNTGIRASFEFVRSTVPDKEEYTQGMEITNAYITEYLDGQDVKYKTAGSATDRLRQIWMQKYLASFFHNAWDSYFEYRRTGYPELPVNPDSNLNDEKTKIPMRWMYPDAETNYNKQNLLNALQTQWGGTDNTNSVMWIVK